jgi:hypothetical protein
MSKAGEVNYPLWTILLGGAAWGNRHKSEADTIAEVDRILSCHLAGDYGDPKVGNDWSWVTRGRHAWDDQGRDIGYKPHPIAVEVWRGMNVNHRGTLVARWIGGERVL